MDVCPWTAAIPFVGAIDYSSQGAEMDKHLWNNPAAWSAYDMGRWEAMKSPEHRVRRFEELGE